MLNLRDLLQTFLDGLSPLDALFFPPERPGSGRNLIAASWFGREPSSENDSAPQTPPQGQSHNEPKRDWVQ